LPQTKKKNNIQDFQNQRYHWYFYVLKRERERASEIERARARKIKRKRKGKGKGKGKREREREDKSAGDFISKPPGPERKICELYCTLQERAVLYIVNNP
jgi:ribosome assembly protein YihI (activator of Der GTPase)